MYLLFLRKLIQKHETTKYVRKFQTDKSAEINKLKLFLNELSNKPDNYELSDYDLFKLSRIILTDSNQEIILNIKKAFASPLFYKITKIIDSHNLDSFPNFLSVYLHPTHYALYNLLNIFDKKSIRINTKLFNTLLTLSTKHYSFSNIENMFTCLLNKNLLHQSLNLLLEKSNEIDSLSQLISQLDDAKILDWPILSLIREIKFVEPLNRLLFLLNGVFPFDYQFIKLLCDNEHKLTAIIHIATLLVNTTALNQTNCAILLKQNNAEHQALLLIFDKLRKSNIKLINDQTFIFITNIKDKFTFEKIVRELSYANAVNKDIFKLDFNQYEYFYIALKYLNKINASEEKIQTLYKLADDNKICELSRLIQLFDKNEFIISKLNLDALLKCDSINNCNDIYRNLVNNDLGNNANINYVLSMALSDSKQDSTFDLLLEKIHKKLLTPLQSHAIKTKRTFGNSRSVVELDKKTKIFIEHNDNKKYALGGFSKIKKGFDTADGNHVIFGIKRINHTHLDKSIKMAQREVKHHRLFGDRNAFFYVHKNRAFIVSNWFEEKSLDHYTAAELCSIPLISRLNLLISALDDLNTLHLKYRVHGDIKPHNFIANFKNNTMRLIDFGSSHRFRPTSGKYATTIKFLDKTNDHHKDYNFCDDIYSMGIVTAYLFPELYHVDIVHGKPIKNDAMDPQDIVYVVKVEMVKKDKLSPFELCIKRLVDTMMDKNRSMRCLTKDALQFCKEVFANYTKLEDQTISEIESVTIRRKDPSLSDALYGFTGRKPNSSI